MPSVSIRSPSSALVIVPPPSCAKSSKMMYSHQLTNTQRPTKLYICMQEHRYTRRSYHNAKAAMLTLSTREKISRNSAISSAESFSVTDMPLVVSRGMHCYACETAKVHFVEDQKLLCTHVVGEAWSASLAKWYHQVAPHCLQKSSEFAFFAQSITCFEKPVGLRATSTCFFRARLCHYRIMSPFLTFFLMKLLWSAHSRRS
jgi:hypothetical protein